MSQNPTVAEAMITQMQKIRDWDKASVYTEKISDLVFDWSLYPRKEVDHKDVVRSYARALKAGCVFPTIKVGLLEGKKIIVDGVHRARARQLNGLEDAECSELSFESKGELFAEAVRLNSEHGKAFSEIELKANITKLKEYKFSIHDIVAFTHVPANEIYRESAAPIAVLTSPSGRKVGIGGRGAPDSSGLIEFKNALKLCLRWAESGRVPIEGAETMSLVIRGHIAFGKVLSNA